MCGKKWSLDFAKFIREQYGYRIRTVEEKEPSRFGPGRRVFSYLAAAIPIEVNGKQFVIRASVIEQDIPLLVSKAVLSSLGAQLDLGANIAKFDALGGVEAPLVVVDDGGHGADEMRLFF